jgi:hypothetical protein
MYEENPMIRKKSQESGRCKSIAWFLLILLVLVGGVTSFLGLKKPPECPQEQNATAIQCCQEVQVLRMKVDALEGKISVIEAMYLQRDLANEAKSKWRAFKRKHRIKKGDGEAYRVYMLAATNMEAKSYNEAKDAFLEATVLYEGLLKTTKIPPKKVKKPKPVMPVVKETKKVEPVVITPEPVIKTDYTKDRVEE